MEKVDVEPLGIAYRLLNPGCVTLVTVGDGQKDNLFALTWNMPVRKDPPLAAIESGKSHYSYPFIQRTGEFGINIMDASHADALYGCGATSGRTVNDKFEKFGLTRLKAGQIKPPLVAESVASLECRVCQVVDLGASSLLIAQIVRAVASPVHFVEGNWTFENGLRLLHHLSGKRFSVAATDLTVASVDK